MTLSTYQITIRASFFVSFNYSYFSLYNLHIPREYIINPIDDRSNICGPYFEDRYNVFIKEAKRMFNKYKNNVIQIM